MSWFCQRSYSIYSNNFGAVASLALVRGLSAWLLQVGGRVGVGTLVGRSWVFSWSSFYLNFKLVKFKFLATGV